MKSFAPGSTHPGFANLDAEPNGPSASEIANTVWPHWLRHVHGSQALDRGATLPEVQSTLGHANVATTSGYLHARPTPLVGSNWTREFFVEEDDD